MANVYFKDKIPSEFEGMRKYAKSVADENIFVVHDLYPFDPSSGIGFLEKWKQKKWYKDGIQQYQQVRVFSEHTRKALEEHFPEAKGKVEVVLPVADSECYQNDEDARDAIRYQFTQGDAYFLYRGPVHAAANIIPLLKGFSIFKKKIGSNMRLVLCGPQGSYSAEILASVGGTILTFFLLCLGASLSLGKIRHTHFQCHEVRGSCVDCREQQHV
jgi:glycosyltransferase involved in cell wall biosynthesis